LYASRVPRVKRIRGYLYKSNKFLFTSVLIDMNIVRVGFLFHLPHKGVRHLPDGAPLQTNHLRIPYVKYAIGPKKFIKERAVQTGLLPRICSGGLR